MRVVRELVGLAFEQPLAKTSRRIFGAGAREPADLVEWRVREEMRQDPLRECRAIRVIGDERPVVGELRVGLVIADPQPLAQEFVNGPIAATTFEHDLLANTGPAGLFLFNRILDLVGVDCRQLNMFSYGVVDVSASAGTATIVLKDANGNVLHDEENSRITCAKTVGSTNVAGR